ncbi:MAG: metallophosphoesterase, partial [Clostridia bacterium]|nr:metallophosphoesterase [Clostridia bacterium]
MKVNTKKSINYKIIIFIALFSLISLFLLTGCTSNIDYSYLIPTDYQQTTADIFIDELGYNSVKLNENRDIKILQLTDLHIGNGILCVKKDKKALENVCALIEYSQPDLIVLTGDLVYPLSIATGTNDNLSALKIVAQIIEYYKTPWTICFGNHDAEYVAMYSKSELCNFLESETLEYCLFDRGPSYLNGMGNHIVNVYNNDNSFNSSIILFDDGDYKNGYQLSGYTAISQEQTDWYVDSLNLINDYVGEIVQSFIFYHVPSKDYEDAWLAYRADNPNVTYFYGWANEASEKISCPDEDSPLFGEILAMGSTKGIFCGHNHLNDFSISYFGVRLTHGKSIDYLAYPGIVRSTEQRGGTLLTLKGLNSLMEENFEISPIK